MAEELDISERPLNVLYFCIANRYRSPVGEIITREIALRHGLWLDVSSAGLNPGKYSGLPHDLFLALRDRGYNPLYVREHRPGEFLNSQHIARKLTPKIISPADFILGFETSDLVEFNKIFGKEYPDDGVSGGASPIMPVDLERKVIDTLTGYIGHPEIEIRRIDNLKKKLPDEQYRAIKHLPPEDRLAKYWEFQKFDSRDKVAREYLHKQLYLDLVDTIEGYVKMAIDKMMKEGVLKLNC
ncbi:hypothetical protein HYV80_06360 [Candidatus Woesearchaeota archaeon]|nr:hypothetical protein [Candidatus Woesearchaeota archaeon]